MPGACPCRGQGEASNANEAVPARDAHISTDGLGSGPRPAEHQIQGTVKNICKPNSHAAVCGDTALLAMRGGYAPSRLFRDQGQRRPPRQVPERPECNVWRRLYFRGAARRWRPSEAPGRPGGSGAGPARRRGGSPSMVRPYSQANPDEHREGQDHQEHDEPIDLGP